MKTDQEFVNQESGRHTTFVIDEDRRIGLKVALTPITHTQLAALVIALGVALVAAALTLILYALQHGRPAILRVTLDEHDFLRLQYAWLIIQTSYSLAGTLPSSWAATDPKAVSVMSLAGILNKQSPRRI